MVKPYCILITEFFKLLQPQPNPSEMVMGLNFVDNMDSLHTMAALLIALVSRMLFKSKVYPKYLQC